MENCIVRHKFLATKRSDTTKFTQPPYPEAKAFPDEIEHFGTKTNIYVVV